MNDGEVSGVDLARVALRAAMEAARKNGSGQKTKKKPRTGTAVRRHGREPMGLGAAIGALVTDRAWELPAVGGTVLDRWPDIAAAVAPQLPDHVAAVAFHPETGQLDLRPDSPAYATQLRLISARIVAAANESADTSAVRGVRVLAVGAAPAPRTAPEVPAAAPNAPQAPVKAREMGSPGFHQALAAHQAVVPPSRVDPSIAEAVERQTKAMRAFSRRAFPEPEVSPENQLAPIEQARVQRRRQAAATEAAAMRRARAERAGTMSRRSEPSLGKTA
ncbi:DciA family protein [Streptomyces sp. NPDC048295]|uniref:DciA family protein n=1 Tax=Streptomyces sp. NPDC048295 TaxID=3154617 RepID=UPI00343286AB